MRAGLNIYLCQKSKTLKLTLAVSIFLAGVSLEPTRGSNVLEQKYSSLVEQHERPWITPKPSLISREFYLFWIVLLVQMALLWGIFRFIRSAVTVILLLSPLS